VNGKGEELLCSNRVAFPLISSLVYLRFTRNATIFKYLLAHFSDIMARICRNSREKEVENGKRTTYDAMPDYVRKPIRWKRLAAWQVF
jgi:hypothetical protein